MCLRKGGVVAFPTDTLYALGADALSDGAVKKVFDIKQRPASMGMPVFIADISDLANVARDVPELATELARRFWPGSVTLVLKKAHVVPSRLTGGQDSVAVRVPDHPIALALLRALGRPVTGSSANISGGPDPVTASHVRESLGGACDIVVDAGPAPLGVPSTIVDLREGVPRLLRAGAVPWEAVESVNLAKPA